MTLLELAQNAAAGAAERMLATGRDVRAVVAVVVTGEGDVCVGAGGATALPGSVVVAILEAAIRSVDRSAPPVVIVDGKRS